MSSSHFHRLIASHVTVIAFGVVAATAYLTVHSATSQSLADYISAICAKSFRSASAAEAPYLAENVSAMTKMMVDMGIRPSGDVDTDFVALMVPHHQGAIEMAQAELRYGRAAPPLPGAAMPAKRSCSVCEIPPVKFISERSASALLTAATASVGSRQTRP